MLTLVTGATGQVGRRFVPRLLQGATPGDEVRVLVRDAARGERFAELGAQVVVGDLRDAGVLAGATAGVDAVVNVAAAFRGVPDEEARAVNRDAAIELGRAAVASGVRRFVQVSTGLVYGAGRGRALVESDGTIPGTHLWGTYPESKWEAEQTLGSMEGLNDLRIARLPFVYGDGDPHLADVMKWAPKWPAMQRLHMGHHVDVAQGLRRLLYAPGAHGVYNIADDAPVTMVDLFQFHGLPVPQEALDLDVPDPWHGVMSTTRIRHELGYRPLVPSVWTAREAGVL
ncbi:MULTISPECIES: NAD(P)-dependent oxidoreductase [Streptomyces]|uniref:NAD(P)-dependent oxidoreductase n=2 Tax=Streptomyces TaxID=1883 RepID=A0A652KPC1_9ACTN|nr:MULTISPECIES: NAD(P)-dependent oxidoreductase [unclassified Streptomyces]MDX3327557.1 NAD(P)-dependent oxidoreductase [Streptomyces sp. ME02-6979-3A]MDX3430035.1 NAD(P)-dependent oxidoreductase [Streptomyces sp. ME01-18a]MDX3687930.1 NAD(P)-dependent oxidoreductase [Streptomyces sp. AK04-4c]RPK34157.1 NAD(P)H azoreductase [Streptomyces sp. ADI93-02]TXS25384.1 NAD(P)-dependent oxidoreductase [Streptomyces sp. gb1(2016)]